ncbi:SDR family oxidoreductase [Mycolicibacterium frederiksbergense]|uniref:NAD-dependent epimerase/dehydratase family protein n=1 Tax=Mycolicibacterium frederiksbergense TaxID=117567 RepID=A0A6H0S3T4_9MYCO|nr:NAD(P)H-binding protein [Mycolicibacterium frederiksbergense]QIV82153.1 NAD-dependent epimerase/dehydratase family protein [Mycolicibacterium frederiksbergense]
MKITVIGATGQIGRQVIPLLTAAGHDVTGASRQTGVDAAIGSGLDEALRDADVVIDVLNSPTLEDDAALAFFTATSSNLTVAAKKAGVQHYVLLSIVGVDGLLGGGYLRGKVVQEKAVAASGLPYTIVRATQFHELTELITGSLIVGAEVHAPDALIQPIASAEVAVVLARIATEPPADGVHDVGGPDKLTFAEMARIVLDHQGNDLPTVVDSAATYFGTPVTENSLVTDDDAERGSTRLSEWLGAR